MKKIFTFLLALVVSAGTSFSAITVRLDPTSCSSWSTVRLFAWIDDGPALCGQWPGTILSQDDEGWYSYTFAESYNHINIIWTDGTNQTVNITNVSESTCYALNSTSGKEITVSVIDCSAGYLTWELINGVLTISGKGDMPDFDDDYEAPWNSYEIRDAIKSVVISNGVTGIGNNSFPLCENLKSISIANSVTRIGDYAFNNCHNLASLTIPSSITSIGKGAFTYCQKITSLTIPSSVKIIGEDAFLGCSSLKSIVVESGNPTYDSRNNCNALIETASNTLIQGCNNTKIPTGITKIEPYAFMNCSGLTSVTIPNNVTSIGSHAFSGCSGLTSVTIPNSVTSIGSYAFESCSGLTSISIPNGVTSIKYGTFSGCSNLKSITMPNSVTNIEGAAFYGCESLKSITIPNGQTSIFSMTFYGCSSLTSVIIPNSVTEIGREAFYSCNGLTSVTIGSGVTSIDRYAFTSCSGLTSIICKATIPPSCEEYKNDKVFSDFDATLYVPDESIVYYRIAPTWKDFKNTHPLSEVQEGIDNINDESSALHKVIKDNQILILRGDKTYTLTGQLVK